MEDFLAFAETSQRTATVGDAVVLTNVSVPWLKPSNVANSPFVQLHNEILSFYAFVSPTALEMQERNELRNLLTDIALELWPDCITEIFGSQMTNILTPTSDLDIAILRVPITGNDSVLDALKLFADTLRSRHMCSYIEVLSNAKVPIIKLDHIASGLSVDICINNSSGLETGRIISNFVKSYSPLRQLTVVLKIFLSQRKLNDTYSGGIGSFVLCTMIVSFIQYRQKLESSRKVVLCWSLGALLVDFFSLYGGSFNFYHCGLSISAGGTYFSKLDRPGWFNPNRANLLAIENPDATLSEPVDMGKNSFMLGKIRRAFEHALQVLTSALGDVKTDSYLKFIIRPDDPVFVGRSFRSDEEVWLAAATSSTITLAEDDTSATAASDGAVVKKKKKNLSKKQRKQQQLLKQQQQQKQQDGDGDDDDEDADVEDKETVTISVDLSRSDDATDSAETEIIKINKSKINNNNNNDNNTMLCKPQRKSNSKSAEETTEVIVIDDSGSEVYEQSNDNDHDKDHHKHKHSRASPI